MSLMKILHVMESFFRKFEHRTRKSSQNTYFEIRNTEHFVNIELSNAMMRHLLLFRKPNKNRLVIESSLPLRNPVVFFNFNLYKFIKVE